MTDDTNPQDDQQQNDELTELEQAQAALAKMTDAAQRSMAEFQNFKRRTEEEKRELQVYANMKLLKSIFPAIDNFARAFEHIPEDLKEHEFIKGIQATETTLMQGLQSLGLEAIDQTGIPADPNLHEVLMEGDGPSGEIVQIFEKGYTFNGKTVRAAKVMIGKGE